MRVNDLGISIQKFTAPRDDPIVYPGKRPAYSYLTDGVNIYQVRFEEEDFNKAVVFLRDKWCDLDEVLEEFGTASHLKKYPILAYGSNASPGQLLKKFKDVASPVVLVVKGLLLDFDVIYGTNNLYGSIPAMIVKSPGTIVECWITLLDEEQLIAMNESEQLGKDYSLGVFNSFQTEFNKTITVYGYVGLMKGYNNEVGDFVALSEIKAENRRLPERSQTQILQEIMSRDLILHFISKFDIHDVTDFLSKLRGDNLFREEINNILDGTYGTSVDIKVPIVASSDLMNLGTILRT